MKRFLQNFKNYGLTAAAAVAVSIPFGALAAPQSVCSLFPSQAPKSANASLGDFMMKFPNELNNLRKAPAKAPVKKGALVMINSSVETEVVVYENFSKWTKGAENDHDSEMVTDAQVSELMDYPGDWTLWQMYQAGGCGYQGFRTDDKGQPDPGYVKSPALNLVEDGHAYYRFSCRARNVNADAQAYGLQAFILDEGNSQIIAASAQPMAYNEWTTCEWIGEGCDATSFMAFSWAGKVLIDEFKVEKLKFPLEAPVVENVEYTKEGSVQVAWNKVEGATSYTVVAANGSDVLTTKQCGDEDSCIMDVTLVEGENYVFYVMAQNGDKISYWGSLSVDSKQFAPSEVGAASAMDATDVTADGFTANWIKADYANKYLVLPVQKHTAKADGENFVILNETFSEVPESADEYNPIMLCSMLGMGAPNALDVYLSRAGWIADIAVLMRLDPLAPGLIITNMYAKYGLPGMLMSPEMDFSVGGGKVNVKGMAMSGGDDIVITACLVDAEGNTYSTADFELNTMGGEFDVTLEGGKPDSRLAFIITDSVDEDMALFLSLEVSTELKAGDTITVPAETVRVGNDNSARVAVPIDDCNDYSYSVQGYFSHNVMGGVSESVDVKILGSGIAATELAAAGYAYTDGGMIYIVNPNSENCEVYTLDGCKVYSTSEQSAALSVEKGVYVVKVGNKTFKVIG